MLDRKTNRPDGARLRAKCFGAIALVAVTASAVMTTPGLVGASTRRAASSICSKVPASKIAAIVGYSVPSGQVSTVTLPATKTNYEISTTNTSCTYGSVASLATLPKVVILTIDTTTKALTPAEFKASWAKLASDGVKMTLKSYSGLGANAYYFAESESGINSEGISVFNGTHGFGAAVESNKLSQAKLAQLAGSL